MTPRLRTCLSALALLALAGCDWAATQPVSISLDFQPIAAANDDGSCSVRYVAAAAGIGTAEWVRVSISRAGTLAEEFVGAETAGFWGERAITAGDQQTSIPVQIARGSAVQIDVRYRVTGPERLVQLQPSCGAT